MDERYLQSLLWAAFGNKSGGGSGSGTPGRPGKDGVSPTVEIENIDGGHRVTITDKDGSHSFDVMDGESGEVGANTGHRELTQAEYNALTDAEKHDGTVYFITDAQGTGSGSAYDDTALVQRIEVLEELVEDMSRQWQGVEYLESHASPNNNQYIDTGIYADQDTRLVIDMQILSNDTGYRAFGNQSETDSKFRVGTYKGTEWLVRYNGQADFRLATDITKRVKIELGQGKFIVDDEVKKDFGAQVFSNTEETILLFAINDTSLVDMAHMRLYSCKIYQGEELVRDYVPVRHKLSTIVGMYDKVDGEIYINKGTGSFNIGEDIDEHW